MESKYRSRKFRLTAGVIALASLFLLVSLLTGGEWVTVILFSLGMYKYANVQEKKNGMAE